MGTSLVERQWDTKKPGLWIGLWTGLWTEILLPRVFAVGTWQRFLCVSLSNSKSSLYYYVVFVVVRNLVDNGNNSAA